MCKISNNKKIAQTGVKKKNLKKNSYFLFERKKTIIKQKFFQRGGVFKKQFRLKIYNKKLFSVRNYKIFINKIFVNKIVIRVKGNNFFCTFLELKKNINSIDRILQADSAGKYKLKTSKKNIKFNLPIVLFTFLKRLKKNRAIFVTEKSRRGQIFFKNIIIKIIAKLGIRREILTLLNDFVKGNKMIYLQPKKCFNGCRAVKARRKKRLHFRIFK
jgi:hypothetical protein